MTNESLDKRTAALQADRDNWKEVCVMYNTKYSEGTVEIAALTKQNNAYKALTESLLQQMATMQAARAEWLEAVNTLASERQANALLTDEIAARDALNPAMAHAVQP